MKLDEMLIPDEVLERFPQLRTARILFCEIALHLGGNVSAAIWWGEDDGIFELLVDHEEGSPQDEVRLTRLRQIEPSALSGIVSQAMNRGIVEIGGLNDRHWMVNDYCWYGLRSQSLVTDHWISVPSFGPSDSRVDIIRDLIHEIAPDYYGSNDDSDDLEDDIELSDEELDRLADEYDREKSKWTLVT